MYRERAGTSEILISDIGALLERVSEANKE
jgi:hypothetical protein